MEEEKKIVREVLERRMMLGKENRNEDGSVKKTEGKG